MNKQRRIERDMKIFYIVKYQGFTRTEVAKFYGLTQQAVGLIVKKMEAEKKQGAYNL